jgi:hypothetical protein
MGRTRESAASDAREMIEVFRARSDAALRGWDTRREREQEAQEREFEPDERWIVEEPVDTVGGTQYRKSGLFMAPPPPKVVKEPKRRRRPKPPESRARKLYAWNVLDRAARDVMGSPLTRLDSDGLYQLARFIVRHE